MLVLNGNFILSAAIRESMLIFSCKESANTRAYSLKTYLIFWSACEDINFCKLMNMYSIPGRAVIILVPYPCSPQSFRIMFSYSFAQQL